MCGCIICWKSLSLIFMHGWAPLTPLHPRFLHDRTMRDLCHSCYSCFSSFFGLQLTFATCPGEKKDKMSPFVLLSSFYSYPFKSLKLANNHYLKLLNITSFYPWYLVILIMELNLNSQTYCHKLIILTMKRGCSSCLRRHTHLQH